MVDSTTRAREQSRSAGVPAGVRTRRLPVQARSRETVERILEAAAAIVAESGVDAATTRLIAERAGVSSSSLYRFFSEREEILDAVFQRLLGELDEHSRRAELEWSVGSIAEFVQRELELHVAFYEQSPAFVRLWFGGRVSPPIAEQLHARNRTLAHRAGSLLIEAGIIDAGTPPEVFELAVELGDRVLELAFRQSLEADREVIERGRAAVVLFLEDACRVSSARR